MGHQVIREDKVKGETWEIMDLVVLRENRGRKGWLEERVDLVHPVYMARKEILANLVKTVLWEPLEAQVHRVQLEPKARRENLEMLENRERQDPRDRREL